MAQCCEYDVQRPLRTSSARWILLQHRPCSMRRMGTASQDKKMETNRKKMRFVKKSRDHFDNIKSDVKTNRFQPTLGRIFQGLPASWQDLGLLMALTFFGASPDRDPAKPPCQILSQLLKMEGPGLVLCLHC